MKKENQKSLTESILVLAKFAKELSTSRYLKIIESRPKLLFYSFLTGIAKGIGFAVGASFVFGLIIWFLSKLSIVPLLGDWIASLLDYIQRTRPY